MKCGEPITDDKPGWFCDACERDVTRCGQRGPESTCTCGWHPASTEDDVPRNEVHNPSVDEELAEAGRCGLTDLQTGRRCLLRARHTGPCRFVDEGAATATVRDVR